MTEEQRQKKNEWQRQYYSRHRKERADYQRRYCEEHREKVRESQKKYKDRNRDKSANINTSITRNTLKIKEDLYYEKQNHFQSRW